MRRVDAEVLEAVGALRNVIGCPASANGRRENEGGKKNALFKEHLMKTIQYFMLENCP
jgi:hypothetical protein